VLVALVHEVINAGGCESIADLSEAVKVRCAQLRIPYTGEAIATAIRQVWELRKGEILNTPKPVVREPEPDPRPMTRDEAAALVSRLRKALTREAAKGRHEPVVVDVKPVPRAEFVTAGEAAQLSAMRQVERLMSESVARCRDLEAK